MGQCFCGGECFYRVMGGGDVSAFEADVVVGMGGCGGNHNRTLFLEDVRS